MGLLEVRDWIPGEHDLGTLRGLLEDRTARLLPGQTALGDPFADAAARGDLGVLLDAPDPMVCFPLFLDAARPGVPAERRTSAFWSLRHLHVDDPTRGGEIAEVVALSCSGPRPTTSPGDQLFDTAVQTLARIDHTVAVAAVRP